MRLRLGVGAARGIETLRNCIQQLETAAQVSVAGYPGEAVGRANQYERAVSTVERLLRGAFEDVPLDRLRGERFWAIVGLRVTRIPESVNDERDYQIEWLRRHETLLRDLQRRFASSDATFAVPDTNALLHYQTFDELDWPTLLGAKSVCLAIPLRVVDELDEKKYARRGELGDRARVVISHIEEHEGGEVRSGVRLEIIPRTDLDPDAYRQPNLAADVEIIEICDGIGAYAPGGQTVLVTGDYGMTIRARSRNLGVFELPGDLQLNAKPRKEPDPG